MVWYNYRRVPAYAAEATDRRRPLGRIFTTGRKRPGLDNLAGSAAGWRRLWRLDMAVAGSGVTGDLLAHNIDTALWLNGPIAEVKAMTETFIKERKHNLTGKVETVGIDDASAFLGRFQNGSLANSRPHAMRAATRRSTRSKSTASMPRPSGICTILHRIQYFDHRDEGQMRGWRSVHVTDGDHPYMNRWWVPGLQIGYEHTFIHQFANFLRRSAQAGSGSDLQGWFGDGLCDRCDFEVCEDAAMGENIPVRNSIGG